MSEKGGEAEGEGGFGMRLFSLNVMSTLQFYNNNKKKIFFLRMQLN